jgi:hypothetical protein
MRYDLFPSARAMSYGHSFIYENDGIIISHWQGEFKTDGKEEEEYLTFKGRDVKQEW